MTAAAAGDVAAFPWQAVMAFGLGVLGHAADQFWRLTPRELAAAIRGRQPAGAGAPAPPGRSDLARLMQRFPDG